MNWTRQAVDRLRRLWNHTSLSASEIAADFGCTRNAIIGKAHRLGLKSRREGQPRRDKRRDALVARLYAAKVPLNEIGEIVGLHTKSIGRVLERVGVVRDRAVGAGRPK